MSLPFSVDEFFALFARSNEAVWPVQVALTLPTLPKLLLLAPSLRTRR